MTDIPDSYAKIKAELRPHWESLVRAVHEKGLYITGFIYGDAEPTDPAGPFLLRFGNVWAESPGEMFSIHYQLALMAAQLEHQGKMDREITHMEGGDESSVPSGPKTPTSLERADKLALALLAVPSDALPDHIQALLNDYAESRLAEKK